MKNWFLFFLFCCLTCTSFSQDLTQEESQLYQLIMQYRAAKGLPSIPLSTSLTFVAKTHAKDLANNQPDQGNCNMHSWSHLGSWTACCYTNDHAQANCMWSKPQELTNYPGNGFEIAYWSSETATARDALASWKNSSGHDTVIVNEGIWSSHPWQAIGIGMYQNYAVVWFGEEKENE